MISGAQSNGQRPIIALMQDLGYRSNEAGVCAGIAMMFVVAVTSHNLSMFNEIISLISKDTKLAEKIRQLKQTIANYKTQHPNSSYSLSHDEQVLINILALFDGIELFQQPIFYSEWFGKALTLYENEQISGFVFPHKAMAVNGMRKIDCWSGIYDQSELKYFLKSLEEVVRTKKNQVSFAISLDNSIHEISLAYDSVSDTWQLCDANHLPPMVFKHADTGELHDILFKAMIENRGQERGKQIAFVSTIYAASADELAMLELIQNLRMSPCFELAHMLSHKKVKAITNNGLTLLHLAAYSGHRDMVNFLISAKCDVNSQLVTGFTPLHLAAFNGNDAIVKNLIDAGADYNIKTKKGLTPIDIAAEFGYEKVVRTLIDAGAQVNTITPEGDTAGHLAAEFGYDAILGMMIQAGADVQRLNKSGFSVTHIAALFGFVNEMSFIIKSGVNLDHGNLAGMTPLHLAVLTVMRKWSRCLLTLEQIVISPIKKVLPLYLRLLEMGAWK